MSDARQLLGMKGASGTSNIWKLRLQLMKPVTWIPLIWGVVCGAAASGNYELRFDHVAAALACMVMSGPLLAGYTQTINDYYDREIDAINEPYRPIPSGAIPLGQVKLQIWVLLRDLPTGMCTVSSPFCRPLVPSISLHKEQPIWV